MQKMEPGIATETINSPETIPSLSTGWDFQPSFLRFSFFHRCVEISYASCVSLLPASSLSFSEHGKYLYATPSSTLAALKPAVPWEKLSFCLPSALRHTYKHLHRPSGYEGKRDPSALLYLLNCKRACYEWVFYNFCFDSGSELKYFTLFTNSSAQTQ